MRIDWALANAGVAMVAAANAGSKRVFLITDNDDPHPPESDPKAAKARKSSLDKLAEFRKIGVRIETFFISSDSHRFDVNKFYADIFADYDDDQDDDGLSGAPKVPKGFIASSETLRGQEGRRHLWDSEIRFQELEKDVSTRETPKRVVFSIRFELAPLETNVEQADQAADRLPTVRSKGRKWQIGIKGYSLVSKVTKGNPVKVVVDDDCGELREVVTHQHYVDSVSIPPLSLSRVTVRLTLQQSRTRRNRSLRSKSLPLSTLDLCKTCAARLSCPQMNFKRSAALACSHVSDNLGMTCPRLLLIQASID